ncbi:VP1 [Betapolyomavirus equi]|uniref:Major capsid protein VP1 n=1 Tax=Betapolyomavirus equi TaxID=1891761 RepID=I3QJF0_9POLY|nr:VP1 [Betapolyomavirus equi]AFK09340.1 VP1 [Betapolyomavirus equi]
MAPKRKNPGVQQVPRLLIRGGIEVLDLKSGEDSITTIECFLNPRVGHATGDLAGYSDRVTVSENFDSTDNPGENEIPCYSCARVPLPMLNDDITCNKILMWEAVSVKTEVVGVSSLTYCHHGRRLNDDEGIGLPIEGINFHMFAVGGEPLELQALLTNGRTTYHEKFIVPKPASAGNQVLNPHAKGRLDKDGLYPVEVWSADPARNENSRYFGSLTGGASTPPVLQFTNTLTTILLDENGIGPLCKGEGLFLSSADIVGFLTNRSGTMQWRGLPRYFQVTLRKRWVKNPYPVQSLLTSLFHSTQPNLQGQPMTGDDGQVEEVRVYEGMEGVPGDPDLARTLNRYGQNITELPQE